MIVVRIQRTLWLVMPLMFIAVVRHDVYLYIVLKSDSLQMYELFFI